MADSPVQLDTPVYGAAAVAALRARPACAARDPAADAAALAGLTQLLADAPHELPQRMAELVRDLCGADAVVIARRETGPDGADMLRWSATAGVLAPHRDASWPTADCPCGAPLLAETGVLLDHPVDFASLRAAGLRLGEALAVPWRVQGRVLGSVAALLRQDSDRRFTAADLHLLDTCAAFAAAAHTASNQAANQTVIQAAPTAEAEAADMEQRIERRIEERLRPLLESERTLREEKALVDATLSIGTVGVMYFDADGTVRDVNPAFERMTGYSAAELRIPGAWQELTPPEFRDVTRRALHDLRDSGSTLPYTKEMVRKDGARWWGLFAPARISGAGPQARCVLFTIDVGANKLTEARLAESDERFRALVEGLAQATWEADADGRILTGSPSWTAYTGQPEGASLGAGWAEMVHPEDRPGALRDWRAAVAARRVANLEFRIRVAAGGWRWTNARAAPLFNRDGSVRKWVGMHIDIDERRRTQAALAESEQRHRMLFEAMDEGFLRATVENGADGTPARLHYVEANPAAMRMAHIEAGADGRLRMPPAHEPCWQAACIQVVRRGISCRSQCYAPALASWCDFFAVPVPGSTPAQVAILFHDITERKRAEDALRESEARFRALADASPALVYQFDIDGNVIYLNERGVNKAVWPQPDHGIGWHSIARPHDMAAYLRDVHAAVRDGGVFVRRVHTQVDDGGWHWFESHVSPWYAGDGAQRGYVGISLDITVAVQAEEALKDADRRKDEFLAMLAHELRNPLAPISNAVQLMLRPDGRRQADRVVEMIGRQVRQIVRLVDDLLEVSRITRGKIALKRERVPFADIVQSAVETSQPGIERAHHLLSVALPETPLVLDADRVRLTQVFSNLLNNAAKYTDSGGRIWFDVRRDGDEAVVSVRDTGIGIAPEDLPRVFDMFAQAHRAAGRGQGGLGIGLTMVRSLVEMHHGRVEAHSAGCGLGSEFIVRLPLAPDGVDVQPAKPGLARPAMPFTGQRILVVDDNRDAADTLGLLLEADGAEVRVVYDGRAALAMAETFAPHSVLLDLGMPGMDGYEVARRLRQDARFAGMRIVALTGWGQDADRRQSRTRGFAHHLTKPVNLDDLVRILV